jgi:hypothetical protein
LLKVIHSYRNNTALTDDFAYYDERETQLVLAKQQQKEQKAYTQAAQAPASNASSNASSNTNTNDDNAQV